MAPDPGDRLMLLGDIERLAQRHVPGNGAITIRRLKRGLMNETYRVSRDGFAYALRSAVDRAYDLGVDREWEARVLERAARAGLAPIPEYCDPQRGILLSRWIDGKVFSPLDVRSPSNIGAMAHLIRRIHALPIPAPPRAMSPKSWIDHYRAGQARANVALEKAAAAQLAELERLPRVAPVLCHSDLHTLNLIDCGDGSLVLLDWEYAHVADPLWDLAAWSANNDLGDAEQRALLTDYARTAPGSSDALRLKLLCWLYDYVCLLWSTLYLELCAESEPHGVAARANLLEARLSAGLQ